MQFALPPRKTSHPPLYARPSSSSALRYRQLKALAVIVFGILSVFFLISRVFSFDRSSSSVSVQSGPNVVLVTVLDEKKFSDKYIQRIKQNREDYAKRHAMADVDGPTGYATFYASTSEYTSVLEGAPQSWAIVPVLRHAMALYPGSMYFFHLSPHSLIMEPTMPIASNLLEPKKLGSLMMKDVPVVPPDSVIKTFSHLSSKDVDLVITQDGENISTGSFVLKQGEWAKYFLDVWFDPLYRRYNFAKAEIHALDHIVQWHPTILAKLALVPQRLLNAYSPVSQKPSPDGVYREGDFIIRFKDCEVGSNLKCENQMDAYFQQWLRKAGSHS
ncbi:putative alpha-1,6-mannosyltransferase mnn11 [Ophidiomyces ophidiicola]|nr:putative alpha-1,6-mannosyltransferase mnn11 [Ophidiomyces ophidiicola]KAI1937571.1 putative alpha-1,6-mannosyltransferase mnn11 [Ophidiomyces ophidiicola]KAI1966772.1 putative alpha-1,6-mannosyltransferase mnn11 [Ophidiomyces ophidiicola]